MDHGVGETGAPSSEPLKTRRSGSVGTACPSASSQPEGLALGVLLRSTAGAIVTVVVAWHVLPLLIHHLPAPWNERLGSLMLSGLPAQILGRGAKNSIYGDLLSPPAAALVLLAYALLPLAAAALVITRRDA